MSTEATPEFARTWIYVRAPSPPEAPEEESVRRALTSCLTWHYSEFVLLSIEMIREVPTLVTAVPARKKTDRRAKHTLQGWMAWITAVRVATMMPPGVRDLWDQAR